MRQKVLSILALLMVSVVSTTHLHAASLNWTIRQVYQSANSSAMASGYAAYMFVTANTTDVTVSNVTTLSDVTTLINQGNISDAIALATVSGSVSDGRIDGATDISNDFSTGTLTAFAIIFDAADAASAEHYFLVNGGNTRSVTFTSGTGVKSISFGNQNSGETSSTVAANWRSVRAPATVDVTGVTLSQTAASMTVGGDALTLTTTVAPDDATDKTVTWMTSDASVASVADGVVTAVGAGTATITATATNGTDDTSDDKTATCAVTVTEPSPALADGSYYVKNGALSLYMAAGGSWGTHGIVNERGLDLIFTYNSGTKTYTIDSNLDNGRNHFLDTGLYMDAPSFGWTVEGENSFTISAILDGVKHYLAVDQNNNLVYTQDGTAENAQWTIIPKADHENAVLAAGLEALKAATAENGVDATFLIACPGFNRNDKRNTEAWTLEAQYSEMGGGGSDGNGCAESYNSTFTLSQTLSNAPAGVYTLTAQGFYKQNGSDNENLPYFYANDEKQTFKLLEDQVYNMDGAGPLFTQGKYTIDPITVVVAEDGALTIGAKLETNTQLWSCWDNFKLTYYGPVMYDLTLADGSNEHGTVAFTVGGNAADKAKKDDVVTVTVTPNEGYSAKNVTVRAYTTWEAASDVLTGGGDNPGLVSDINVTKQENGTWQFTMPEANVWVVVTYAKNLQDAWIQAIADQTWTGSAIEPSIEVKDGETILTLNTDYTVAYSNNVETGTATVTVTGTGNYSGTATANFTIVADKSALNTAITEAEAYYNSIKDDHTEAAAALKTAIDTAKAMQEKGDATQEEVNNALSALNTAKTTAEGAVLTETKNELNDDITKLGTILEAWFPLGGRGTGIQTLSQHEVIKDIAQAHQKSTYQVILRWHLQSGIIAIPGSSNAAHIAEDYDIFDFELTPDEMQRINDLECGHRFASY